MSRDDKKPQFAVALEYEAGTHNAPVVVAKGRGHVAETINATENRIETLLVRALEQLKQMEERNRALEERATQAEARAREAEKWLMRLHVEMEDKFISWKGAQTRNLAGSAAA